MFNKSIKVKDIKVNLKRSQETYCYHAKIYIGNYLVGSAQNDGHGATTSVEIKDEFKDAFNKIIDAMEKIDIGLNYKIKMTPDLLVDFAVHDHVEGK